MSDNTVWHCLDFQWPKIKTTPFSILIQFSNAVTGRASPSQVLALCETSEAKKENDVDRENIGGWNYVCICKCAGLVEETSITLQTW